MLNLSPQGLRNPLCLDYAASRFMRRLGIEDLEDGSVPSIPEKGVPYVTPGIALLQLIIHVSAINRPQLRWNLPNRRVHLSPATPSELHH